MRNSQLVQLVGKFIISHLSLLKKINNVERDTDDGGGDRTRTCTGLPLNGFLDRGSTNYAYSSMVESGIYIEASNSRWRASPRYRASLLGLLRTSWCPQTLGFKCLVLGSNVSTFFHPVLSGIPRWSIQLIRSIALSMVIHYQRCYPNWRRGWGSNPRTVLSA